MAQRALAAGLARVEGPAWRLAYVGHAGSFRPPRWFMRDMHMNPAEAAQALLDCGAEVALGHHYGTFQLTDEPIDAPVRALAEALQTAGIPPERFAALRPGQVFSLPGLPGST